MSIFQELPSKPEDWKPLSPSPTFLQPSLIKSIELAKNARVKGVSGEKLLESAARRRESMSTCRQGSSLPFPTYLRWIQGLAGTLGLDSDLDPSPPPSVEDMKTGLHLLALLSYCSREADGALTFLDQLVDEESPATLLLAIVNTIQVKVARSLMDRLIKVESLKSNIPMFASLE